MNARRILALAALAVSIALPAAAEQPAAAEYRMILASDHFVVSYIEDGATHRLVATDGNRLSERGRAGVKGPNGAQLDAIYMDGMYYKFYTDTGKLYARVLPADALGRAFVNREEGWETVTQQLALPEELTIFQEGDRFGYRAPSVMAPTFNGSTERTVDDMTYACDQYVSDIRTQAGTTAGQLVYNALYADGKLVKIQRILLARGEERLLGTLEITEISGDVPDSAFRPAQEIPVYAAGMGGLNDMLGNMEQVGTLGGKADE